MPEAYGGAGVSFATLVKVIAIISAADPSIGQIPQNQLAALDAIRVTATEEQKRLWFGRMLQGYRLGNAFSEKNSKHVGAFETTVRRDGDGFVVNGEKFCHATARSRAAMTREIRLNAFDMNCVGHQSPGLWAHPRDRSWQYKDLEYWTELAQILECAKFDGLFIADVLGVYDVSSG